MVTRTLTVSNEPAAGDPPPAAPIQMSASLERTTYALGGGSVALHREGQQTPGGPYIEELYYMHGNHLGSMTLLTDEAGAVVEQARYYPFGGYRLEPSTAITDIGFTGHRQDNLGWENTGLIYMGARYYDPLLRRFVSADTIVADGENSLAYNRFAYVKQNPVNLVDPTRRMELRRYSRRLLTITPTVTRLKPLLLKMRKPVMKQCRLCTPTQELIQNGTLLALGRLQIARMRHFHQIRSTLLAHRDVLFFSMTPTVT